MAEKIMQPQLLEWKINVKGGIESNPPKFCNPVIKKVCKLFQSWTGFFLCMCDTIWKIGSDDRRRIIHSVKFGLALSLVSLFYFMRPLFDSVGGNAIWAVMTVVVVFEFTVGATLSKGLNRCLATLVAGSLGVGVGYLAQFSGDKGGLIFLAISIFALGAVSTFSRFIPKIKKKYDYGVVIFILTFNLIAISSYREENLFQMAYRRLPTVIIGCILCFFISIVLFPIWAGDDLHDLIIQHLGGLAGFIEECVAGFFIEDGKESDASNGYKCVLNSKTTEECLANFATWEPWHGNFFYKYPWSEYVKVGAKMRYCAYSVEALNGLLNSQTQAPFSLKEVLKTPCIDTSKECSNILHELAKSMRSMTKSNNKDLMINRLSTVVEDLQSSLSSQPELFIDTKRWQIVQFNSQGFKKLDQTLVSANMSGDQPVENKRTPPSFAFVEGLPVAVFASLVIEIVARLENLILAVDELAEKAKFKAIEGRNASETATINPPKQSVEECTVAVQRSVVKIGIIEDHGEMNHHK